MPTPSWPIGLYNNTQYNQEVDIDVDLNIGIGDYGSLPIDGTDDNCVRLYNGSANTVYVIRFELALLSYGGNIFAFDGGTSAPNGPYVPGGIADNIQDFGTPGPAQGILPAGYVRKGYEGPDNYFGDSIPFDVNASGYVYLHIPGGLPPGQETYFGTEAPLQTIDYLGVTVYSSSPPAECPFAEDEDDAAPTPTTWPECDLIATRISVKAISPTVSPGRSFTSLERVIQADAGSWEIELQDIPINTRDDVLLWRQIESDLNGRANTILVPVYEGKLSGTPIAATANANVASGAVILAVNKTAGAALQPGMQFSDLVGQLYRVKSVVSVSGNINTVKVWPPVRKPITAGDALEFNKPVCRCRLASDDGMNAMLELLTSAKPSVRFWEDV